MMQKFKICKILFISLTIFIMTFSLSSKSHEKTVLLYAPISLSEVIKELINSYKILNNKIKIKPVFMGTSQLVMQVKNGANPDLFISANVEWMDYLERKKIILKKYRKDYLYNSLVVITNKENSINAFKNIKELENAFLKSKTKISLAMTNSIPAGMYAKDFLENIGIWKNIKKKYVESPNVRAALNYVARNELEFGIVYKTEAVENSKVKIVYFIDNRKHKKITYPIAVLNDKKETMEVYDFFLDNKNLTKTLKWGFEILK
ncbi:MAG: molybdate ABC transporter substrate-binding protein [Alphaproteobacteria bacterium]|nr:MAG: molybdate ABC transporter substrate-binding protein [Alphaproteobacteria bacterium]